MAGVINRVPWISVQDRVCANCKHFVQHYIRIGGQLGPCNAGHCTEKRHKNRKPTQTCEGFEWEVEKYRSLNQGEAGEEVVITSKYIAYADPEVYAIYYIKVKTLYYNINFAGACQKIIVMPG